MPCSLLTNRRFWTSCDRCEEANNSGLPDWFEPDAQDPLWSEARLSMWILLCVPFFCGMWICLNEQDAGGGAGSRVTYG